MCYGLHISHTLIGLINAHIVHTVITHGTHTCVNCVRNLRTGVVQVMFYLCKCCTQIAYTMYMIYTQMYYQKTNPLNKKKEPIPNYRYRLSVC